MTRRRDLVRSRLRPPVTTSSAVARTRLLDEAFWQRPLVLVSAPAGFGKTTLLQQHATLLQMEQRPVGWLTLGGDDRYFSTFWTGLLAAVEGAYRTSGDTAYATELGALEVPPEPEDRSFLTALATLLATAPAPLTLILDDGHELRGDAVQELLGLLGAGLPDFRVIIAGRWDPSLPVARLVMEGEAAQVRATELSFDASEAARLLGRHGVVLDDRQLESLLINTEGWAAGLQLAALTLAQLDPEGVDDYIDSFADDARPVADYLVEQILTSLPEDTIALMIATAVPTQVPIELAVELSGRSDAGAALERLAQANLMITRQAGSPPSYRFHALLRGYLLAEGSRRDLRRTEELQAITARWFERHRLPEGALAHWQRANRWGEVVRLLDEHGVAWLVAGSSAAVERAANGLPPEWAEQTSMVLLRTAAAGLAGQLSLLRAGLVQLGPDATRHRTAAHRVLHAVAQIFDGTLAGASFDAVRPLAEPASEPVPTSPVTHLLGTLAVGRLQSYVRDFGAAEATLAYTERLAADAGYDYLALDCLSHLVTAAAGRGDHVTLWERANRAVAAARSHGWTRSVIMSGTYGIAAWAAFVAFDSAALRTFVQLGREVEGAGQVHSLLAQDIFAAYLAFEESGDFAGLRRGVNAAWVGFDPALAPPQAYAPHVPTELNAALHVRDRGWVREVAQRAAAILPDAAQPVVSARLELAEGRSPQAIRLLDDAHLADESSMSYLALWGELIRAGALVDNHRPVDAHEVVLAALEQAVPAGLRRLFVDAPPQTRRLMLDNAGRFGPYEEFLAPVLVAFRDPSLRVAAHTVLSPREGDLLLDLVSTLTVAEIAEARSVSPNTIRTQVKSIYRKLGVNTRRDAVREAQRVGFL